MNQKLINYLQIALKTTIPLSQANTRDKDGQLLLSRQLTHEINNHIDDFLVDFKQQRWIIALGLRGVGKTTVLYQTALHVADKLQIKTNNNQILYISLDEVIFSFNSDLNQLLLALEQLVDFSDYSQPFFIFLDEVQADPDWALILKIMFDKHPNVFFVCSGSAATELQLTADIAGRRALVKKMYPLSFVEFQALKTAGKEINQSLTDKLIDSLYFSENAGEVYKRLKDLQKDINQEWIKYDRNQIYQYFQIGATPSLLPFKDPFLAQKSLNNMVNKIIINDIALISPLKGQSIILIKKLLPLLAAGDIISHQKICQLIGAKRSAFESIISNLVKAELLMQVSAYGSNFSSQRNPYKYLFASPSIRQLYFTATSLSQTKSTQQGLLLEDLASLHYLRTIIDNNRGDLKYPYSRRRDKSSDFVLQLGSHQIAIEFGLGAKTHQQVERTMKRIDCRYGLTFANSQLELNQFKNSVIVPLDYFYLI